MNKQFIYDSPFGKMRVVASHKGLVSIDFDSDEALEMPTEETAIHKTVNSQLEEYFSGERKKFDVKLDLNGTNFQNKVWKALYDIDYGEIVTYKQIAEKVGSPRAFRAVGNANNRNPIPIICACHRVVGSDGSLVGYAYGLKMKEQLIDLETKDMPL